MCECSNEKKNEKNTRKELKEKLNDRRREGTKNAKGKKIQVQKELRLK
jgi:hypothetical protein